MDALTVITLSAGTDPDINDAFKSSARAHVIAECNTPEQLLSAAVRLRPSAVVIDLSGTNGDQDFDLIKKLAAANPDIAIITSARDPSPGLILGSMRAGAREFLQLPIIGEEFQTVLDSTIEFCEERANSLQKRGRTIAVFSGKGGTGASFFSINLAAAMNVSTLLMDLNLQSGDTASFLGLDAKYSIADLVHNRNRWDDALISNFVTHHSARLSLLSAPTEAYEAEDIRPQDITEVLHVLSQKYDCVVLDLQHTFDPITVAALDSADDILLLLTLDIPGIRSTKRALTVFDRLGYPRRKVHVVVNRWSKAIDVELQKVESHLNEQIIGFIPNDYRKVMESINLGRPLVQAEPTSKITSEIKRIAEMVIDSNHTRRQQPRRKLFRAMFGREENSKVFELSTISDPA